MRQYQRAPGSDQDRLAKVSWPAVVRLLSLSAPHKTILGLAALMMLVNTGVQLYLPIIGRTAINTVIAEKSVSHLDQYVVQITVLILAAAAFGFGQYMLAATAGNRIVREFRLQIFGHLQRLPVAYFDRARSGDLVSYLSNDVSQIQSTLTDDIVKLPANVLTMLGGLAIAVYLDWRLSVIVVTILMLTMLYFVVSGRRLRRLNRRALDALSDGMGAMGEALANIRLVKAFAREPYEDGRARGKLQTVYGLNLKSAASEGTMGTVGTAGVMLMLLGVSWYGGRSIMEGSLKVGDLLGFFVAIMVLSPAMASLAALYTKLQRAVGAAERLFAIMDEASEPADDLEAVAFPAGETRVSLCDVRFSYVNDVPVLQDLSLEIQSGKVTAIVGPSGSGKTTVASLIFRFYEPQEGQILIDDVPVRLIRRSELRENVGIVPQEPILFNGTIFENILYGRLSATREEVEAAAKLANVDEFVSVLPQGYETLVGERGITLSGGQRQRVAIARAVLKDPKILILDEATSALDTKSESLVKEALDRLMNGRTTLVIAHRLSTVQNAHQIAVLAGGRVVEMGSHDELIQRQGHYAELYEFVGA